MSYPIPEAAPVIVIITSGEPSPNPAPLKENGNTKIQWQTYDNQRYEITPTPGLMKEGDNPVYCGPGSPSEVLAAKPGKASPIPYPYRINPPGESGNPPEILVEN